MQQFFKQFFKGFFTWAFTKTITYPFQRTRLLKQLQPQIPQLQNEQLNNLSQCLQFIIQREGEEGIFAGIFYQLIRYIPEQLLSSFSGRYTKRMNKWYNGKTQPLKFLFCKALSGTIAGGFTLIFIYPFDMVQFKLFADVQTKGGQKSFQGIIDCLYQTIKSDGIFGLYKGCGSTLAGMFFYRLFYFQIYDFLTLLRIKIEKKYGQLKGSKFLIDYITSQTASTLTYPLDTIRKQQMVVRRNENFIKLISNTLFQRKFFELFRGNMIKFQEGLVASLILRFVDEFMKKII